MSGIPIDPGPLRHLFGVFEVDGDAFYRPRNHASVSRYLLPPDDRSVLDVVGFVVEDNEMGSDSDDREWAVGLVAKNPFYRQQGSGRSNPEWWPEMADESELVVCALRSWHPMNQPKRTYRLWSCESAWTSDALALRPVADWDNES